MKRKNSKRQPVLRHKTGGDGNPVIAEAGKATRWQPGQSGNPGGRPRSLSARISDELRILLRSDCPTSTDGQQRTWAEVIALRLCLEAAKGNIHAATEIADRTEGRPPQAFTVGGGLEIEFDDEKIMERIRVLTDRVRTRMAVA